MTAEGFFRGLKKEEEAYLESPGEEIVTVTVDYEVHDHATNELYKYGGFPAVVWPQKGYDYMNGGDSPFDETYGAYTFMVDEDGQGSFDFRMPKSLYEKTLDGNCYFTVCGGLDKTNRVDTCFTAGGECCCGNSGS